MVVCSAANCCNSSRKEDIRFFKYPSDKARREVWIANSGLDKDPGPCAKLCGIHFEESQFELKRQDGWKKLKPNAVPTIFPEPTENSKPKRVKSASRKRKRSPSSDEEEVIVPKKKSGHKKKKDPVKKRKQLKIKIAVSKKKKSSSLKKKSLDGLSGESSPPRLRKSPRPRKLVASTISDSSEDESDEVRDDAESEDDAEQQIALLKRENESMKQEIAEFEKHNKSMARVILELEKHNKLMGLKLVEMDKDKIVMSKKISDLERMNEDLKNKLNNSFSEEQLARMDKMRQLGTIERYIPALK